MEIEFEKERRKGEEAPVTRMYAPTKGKKRDSGQRKKRGRNGEAEFAVDEDGYRIRVAKDTANPLERMALIFCGFLFAGMVLFTLSGYERITRAYADINVLNNEIDQTNLRIVGLDVEIECAVTIQQAQEAAIANGMRYPEQAQLVELKPVAGGGYNFTMPVLATTEPETDTAGADGNTGTGDTGGTTPEEPTEPVDDMAGNPNDLPGVD